MKILLPEIGDLIKFSSGLSYEIGTISNDYLCTNKGKQIIFCNNFSKNILRKSYSLIKKKIT